MEPWRAYIPVVADFHHFFEEQDPEPQYSEKPGPDPHLRCKARFGSRSALKVHKRENFLGSDFELNKFLNIKVL